MRRCWRTTAILLAISIFSTAAAGCSAQEESSSAAPETTRRAQSAPYRAIIADALDDESVPGVSMESALARVGTDLSLPSEAVVGAPIKVVVDDIDAAAGAKPGLLVLYDSGVKLKVRPGVLDIDAEAGRASASGTSVGRPFTIENVAGRRSIVNRGQDQSTETGTVYEGTRLVTWNLDGMTYTLAAANESVPLGTLVAAAQSIK